MSWNLVRLDQVSPQPWRNGGGLTRELLAWPARGDWRLRLSVAEVTQDGPFSQFDGVRRWFAVLSGGGVRLLTDGRAYELTAQSQPFQFDGAARTGCQLRDGPTRDFNLMWKEGRARMERLAGSHTRACKAATLVACYANEVAAVVVCGDEQTAVPAGTLAWRILDADAPVHVAGEGALWMEIEP